MASGTDRRCGPRRALLAGCLIGLAAVSVRTAAAQDEGVQDEAALDRVERLADLGQAREARQALDAWEREHGETAPLNDQVRAWFLGGRLSDDAAAAELLYLRVVIEGSNTPYADDALLRLGQYKYAAKDYARAIEYLGRLRRDYPTSELGPEALLWVARAARASGDEGRACSAAKQGLNELPPASNPDLEIALLEQQRGCRDVDGTYTVQVAAFKDDRAAQSLARELLSLGYDAWVLNATDEDPIYRVRVGRGLVYGEAQALNERLTRMGYSPFIVQLGHSSGD